MRVIGFIGSSGTGKSHRALWVAREQGLDYIIDDGLLIYENGIIAGKSAKKAPSRISSIKIALFHDEVHREQVKKAILDYAPKGILILGTSDAMVNKIAAALCLGEILERVYIEEVATPLEIEQAKNTRIKQGKHVIPVPAMEIKKQFSGYFLDPLQLFKRKGKAEFQKIGEKTVVRPTFSYYGKYTISDYAIYQVINHIVTSMPEMEKITRFRCNNSPDGLFVDMDVIMVFGYSLVNAVKTAKESIANELDRFAGINLNNLMINVKNLVLAKT